MPTFHSNHNNLIPHHASPFTPSTKLLDRAINGGPVPWESHTQARKKNSYQVPPTADLRLTADIHMAPALPLSLSIITTKYHSESRHIDWAPSPSVIVSHNAITLLFHCFINYGYSRHPCIYNR